MTMLSFRVAGTEADEVARWARRLGVGRSALLRDALDKFSHGSSPPSPGERDGLLRVDYE